MTPCENIKKSIGPWLDGELGHSDAESVRAHLNACVGCAATCGQWEKIQSTLKDMLAAEAASVDFTSFWREVQGRIHGRQAWHEIVLDRCRAIFSTPRSAWAVPAIILLLLSFISVDSFWPGWRAGSARSTFAVVDSIDAHGRSVALLREDETKTTVIWLYEVEEGEHETAEDTPTSGPAF
jgi:hypothetical protein